MSAIDGILQFNKDRNLRLFNAVAERNMLAEELEEFEDATQNADEHEQVDALADTVVLAVGALHKMGYDPEAVLTETLKEINSRQGELNEATGKWEKDRNQDPTTLYKAVYTKIGG